MSNAHAAVAAAPRGLHDSAPLSDRLELFGLLSLFGVAAFLQLSIAIAQVLLTIALLCWVALLISRRERFDVPRFFWPLAAYGAATLVSAAFSAQPRLSFVDSKQLVLFLLVPAAYRLFSGSRGSTMLTVVLSVGAASAAFGIFQYGLLHYDHMGQRPQGTLGHYMTYAGLLMLVIGIALAKMLFGRREWIWPALVMPALMIAIVLTSTRSAWVGACAAAAVLLTLKDFRLLAVLPVLAAVLFAFAPPIVMQRVVSIFDRKDPTKLDRLAMLREGQHMVRSHPLVGVGPNMVKELYSQYREPDAVQKVNPHLHNVPVQIAAERGLPALAIWLWFIVVLTTDLVRRFRTDPHRVLPAAALAAVVAMLAAGLFEYNFGDSEFLMLFLLVVTLPFAAARSTSSDAIA
jgi:O-antigen ligase